MPGKLEDPGIAQPDILPAADNYQPQKDPDRGALILMRDTGVAEGDVGVSPA